MKHAPFAGRRPIFIGDDTTDEPVFPVIPEFGGLGFSVGRRVAGVPGHFDRPRDVRRWLEILAVGTTP
jgi:trehalose 6-phosphate phosphatase